MVEFKSKFNDKVTESINKMSFKKLMPLFIILSGVFIVLGLFEFLFPEEGSVGVGIMFILIGVLYTPLVLLLTKFVQKSINKSMSIMSDETEQTIRFDEERIEIIQIQGDKYEGITKSTYDLLYKVIETATHYFLYISRQQMFVVEKSSITEGTLQELNQILEKNLDKKFKRKK